MNRPPIIIRAGSRIIPNDLFSDIVLSFRDGVASLYLAAHERHARALSPIIDRDTTLTAIAAPA